MEYHRVPFPEALKDLARRYGVDLPEGSFSVADKKKADIREKLFSINETAASYFAALLHHKVHGSNARDYLEKRGLSQEIIYSYKLGYAAGQWEGLVSHLRRSGIDLGLAAQSGLIISKNDGYYDRFRGRVIFPISNLTGQIVGFGGRSLDDSLPKYLNSPEGSLFHKGELLYGLHESLTAIREAGRVIIVEGYMDCLALRCHGIGEVVAVLGTALTEGHVRRLKGFALEAFVVFDSDDAGRAAAIKSLPLFLNEGLAARAVALPEGDDPDSYIREKGRSRFLELIEAAPPLFDFLLNLKIERISGLPEEKVAVMRELMPILCRLSDDALCSLYVRRLSQRLEMSEAVIWREVKKEHAGLGRENEGNCESQGPLMHVANDYGSDFHILNLMVYYPESFLELKNCKWPMLTGPVTAEIISAFFELFERKGKVVPGELAGLLQSEEANNRLREILLHPCLFPEESVSQAVMDFKEREQKILLKERIRDAKERGDLAELNSLLKLKGRMNRRELH
jgi:DNA primase